MTQQILFDFTDSIFLYSVALKKNTYANALNS